jgi:hypothetical protein
LNRIKHLFFGSRKRAVISVVAAFLTATATASAALFLLFSGASGGANGTFATTTTSGALTYFATALPALGPGDVSAPIQFSVTNNDPAKAHGVGPLTATFTSTPSICAASLSIQNVAQLTAATNYDAPSGIVFAGIPAGSGRNLFTDSVPPATGVTVTLAANAPPECANGTWSLALTGTTTSS